MGPCRHLKIHMHKTLSEPQYTHREHKSNLDLFLKKSSESKRQTHSWGSWFLYILPSCLARYWSISSSWTCDAECERDMEDEAEEDREEWGCAVSMFSLEEPADDGKRKSMSPCLDRKSVWKCYRINIFFLNAQFKVVLSKEKHTMVSQWTLLLFFLLLLPSEQNVMFRLWINIKPNLHRGKYKITMCTFKAILTCSM